MAFFCIFKTIVMAKSTWKWPALPTYLAESGPPYIGLRGTSTVFSSN